jgi:hypothetical protein
MSANAETIRVQQVHDDKLQQQLFLSSNFARKISYTFQVPPPTFHDDRDLYDNEEQPQRQVLAARPKVRISFTAAIKFNEKFLDEGAVCSDSFDFNGIFEFQTELKSFTCRWR